MIRILHIVPDDKFINDARIVMDSVSNTSNRYVCPVENELDYKAAYITDYKFVDIISYITLEELCCKEDLDIIAFHTIPYDWYKYVISVPQRVKVWWLVWGYDIYTDTSGYDIKPIIPLKLYKQITLSYIVSKSTQTLTFYGYTKRIIKILVNYNGNRDRVIMMLKKKRAAKKFRQKLLERIDYLSTILPVEYDMLLKIKGVHAKYIPFQYPFITNSTPASKSLNASYILLGNSSDSTNNHLDILEIIKKRNIHNKVFIPLAYGDTEYKMYLKDHIDGYENIILQENFVSRDEYMLNLSKCRVAIMGHIRQQALGNIAMAMMLGMKIFLYKDSVSYNYLKRRGFVVYSIEDDLSQTSIDEPTTEDIDEINRVKVRDLFSYSSVQIAVKNFFSKEEF